MNTHTFNKPIKTVILGLSLPLLLFADISPQAPLGVDFVREAKAIIGVPFSPLSVGGVARRTTRRAVAVSSSSAAAASSQQQAATAQQQEATAQQQAATAQQQAEVAAQQQAATAPQPQAHRPEGAPPIGSIVAALPAGCNASNVTIGGVQYSDCAGVYYRAAFQGNNLVYVVSQP